MSRTAAVVLAAGASTRLGEPKQFVMLGGETLLERAVRTAREAGCSPAVVVLGAAHAEILAKSSVGGAVFVINDEWMEGIASSIRLGVQTLQSIVPAVDGVLLMTCDQPAVTTEHLRRVMDGEEVMASRYAGRNGVPAYFSKRYFGELMSLTGDVGAKGMLAQARSEDLEHGELDLDTPDDFVRMRDLFG